MPMKINKGYITIEHCHIDIDSDNIFQISQKEPNQVSAVFWDDYYMQIPMPAVIDRNTNRYEKLAILTTKSDEQLIQELEDELNRFGASNVERRATISELIIDGLGKQRIVIPSIKTNVIYKGVKRVNPSNR